MRETKKKRLLFKAFVLSSISKISMGKSLGNEDKKEAFEIKSDQGNEDKREAFESKSNKETS